MKEMTEGFSFDRIITPQSALLTAPLTQGSLFLLIYNLFPAKIPFFCVFCNKMQTEILQTEKTAWKNH